MACLLVNRTIRKRRSYVQFQCPDLPRQRRRSKLQGCIIGLREHDATEIFDAHTHKSLGLIGSSEEMIEIDFC